MGAPERIHCRWNAADAADAFHSAGIELGGFFRTSVQSEQIVEALAKRQGIFRLLGRVAATNEEVTLKILNATQDRNHIDVETTFGPEFTGEYEITDNPLPLVTIHGDVLFDLTKITL